MEDFTLGRFPNNRQIYSNLDHLQDSLDTIAFLTAEGFVYDVLKELHSKTDNQAKRLAPKISSHAKLALRYAKSSLDVPAEISFLPAYYAVLNLAKIYCFCGPFENEFSIHTRWHGASYTPRSSQTLMTEEVIVQQGGALALFYKTLTGTPILQKKTIKIRDIYHQVEGISAELTTLLGEKDNSWGVFFQGERIGGSVTIRAQVFWDTPDRGQIYYSGPKSRIPVLKNFKKQPGSTTGQFTCVVPDTTNRSVRDVAFDVVRTEFLRSRPSISCDLFNQQDTAFPLPPDFAAALAFFHMSSVCRYNPEKLEKIMNSSAWPVLLSLRRHSLMSSILLCYGYVMKSDFRICGIEG